MELYYISHVVIRARWIAGVCGFAELVVVIVGTPVDFHAYRAANIKVELHSTLLFNEYENSKVYLFVHRDVMRKVEDRTLHLQIVKMK